MAFASYGTLLQMGDGATPTEHFATIAGVGDIAGPALSRDLVEVTSHSSEDGYEEQVPTIKRSGQVTYPLRWDPDDPTHDGETGVLSLVGADDPTNFRMVYPRIGKMWAFRAYVTAFNTLAPVAGVGGADVTMKITGKPQLLERGGFLMAGKVVGETVAAEVEAPSADGHAPVMRFLSAADILAADDIGTEVVQVPEWKGAVRVRGLTGKERDDLEISMVETRGKSREVNLRNMRARLVAASVVDADGKRLFTPTDIEALGRKSAAAIQRIFKVAQKLSGLADDEVEELVEGFEPGPSDASGSA